MAPRKPAQTEGEHHDHHEEMFTPAQIEIIKKLVVTDGGSADDAVRFVEVCKIRRLNPIAGQIHAMFRNNNEGTKESPRWVKKMTVQTGIDAYRLIAERSGKYEGQTKTEWCDKDLNWYDVWPFADKPPFACRLGIHRAGFREPMVKTATYSEYAQTNKDGTLNRMWRERGPAQLAKCCEALGLRAAFPEELGGMYTDDEMAQADNEHKYEVESHQTASASAAQPKSNSTVKSPAQPPPAQPKTNGASAQGQPAAGAQLDATVAYIVKASDELKDGLNAVEGWCRKILGHSWMAARKLPDEAARVKLAIDAGELGEWTAKPGAQPAGVPAQSASTPASTPTACKCGAEIKGKFCNECGAATTIGAADPFKNGGT